MCLNFKKIEQKMDMVGSRESFSENTRLLCGLSWNLKFGEAFSKHPKVKCKNIC